MSFVMNELHQRWELHSLLCLARDSMFLFYELSKFKKAHKAQPELMAEALCFVT